MIPDNLFTFHLDDDNRRCLAVSPVVNLNGEQKERHRVVMSLLSPVFKEDKPSIVVRIEAVSSRGTITSAYGAVRFADYGLALDRFLNLADNSIKRSEEFHGEQPRRVGHGPPGG